MAKLRRRSSQLLLDMRVVYQGDKKDLTSGQKKLKGLFEDNPKEFVSQLRQMEKEHRDREKRSDKEGPGAAGEKEACLELVEKLLAERGWE